MTQDQLSVLLSSGRHLVSYVAGAATVFGIMSQATSADLATDFDHLFNGIKEIAIGVGPIATLVMGWWSAHNATTQAKVAAVQAAEPHALVQAVQAVAPVTLRDAVAAQPEVKAVVVTSQAVADASPSEKVKT